MQAIQVREFGGPEVLVEAELPDPVAGPGEVVVAVAAGAQVVGAASSTAKLELVRRLGAEAADAHVATHARTVAGKTLLVVS